MKKLIIISGADGSLGQAFLQTLAAEQTYFGNYYVLTGLKVEENSSCKRLAAALPLPYIAINLNLSKDNAAEELTAAINAELGCDWQITCLINNAGIGFKGPFAAQNYKDQELCLKLNVFAPTLLLSYFLEKGKFSPCSRVTVINVASSSAFTPQANFAVYSAGKSYLRNFSIALNAEWQAASLPWHCTVACPGPMLSAFLQTAAKYLPADANKNSSSPRKATAGLPLYKKLALENPLKVAKSAVRAAKAGKDVSYSSFITYILRCLAGLLPAGLFARLTGK